MVSKGVFHTKRGDFPFELYDTEAPNTVKNFVQLAQGDYKGYKEGIFHRVLPGFVIQGGDPTYTGSGGPGYKIKCELDGEKQFHDKGMLSMAHAGRNTGGSQFFIVLSRQQTAHLDKDHTVFGKVTDNLQDLDSIQKGDNFTVEITEVDSKTEARELKKI
ncbi:MAG: peptidylprolyl isomerase [Candidatus Heimdallarchaeota archaeon]|nr:peptidylprolyl isomerase [Candidatus Heimdallarchaeota archaeon]